MSAPAINRFIHRMSHRSVAVIHMMRFLRSTSRIAYGHPMDQHTASRTAFEVTLADGSRERVCGANAYQQEQSMTTFFNSSSDRQTFDCWSVRVASFRTDSILSIRRVQTSHTAPETRRHLLSA